MGQCRPCKRLPQPEQTLAGQLQQRAGLRSVLNAAGWWTPHGCLLVIYKSLWSIHLLVLCVCVCVCVCVCRWWCPLLKVACPSAGRETHFHKMQNWNGTTGASSRAWSTRYSAARWPDNLFYHSACCRCLRKKKNLCLCCFQKGPQGMHSLQVNVGLDKVSPVPCPSHTLLTKIQTNLRDRLEHTVLLGLCPPQPVSPHICMSYMQWWIAVVFSHIWRLYGERQKL